MGTTSKLGLPYPENTAAVDVVYDMSQLATTAESVLTAGMTAYTPTLNFYMGTIEGWWKRVSGSNLVAVTFNLVVAAGATPSTNSTGQSLTVSLPVNAYSFAQITGHGNLIRSGAYHPFLFRGVNTGFVGMVFPGGGTTAGTIFTQNTWTGWDVGDAIYGTLLYRAGS